MELANLLGVTLDAQALAHAIVRDAEGATKFITVKIEGGRDEAECQLAAYAIAHSPLVKTAFFASDPKFSTTEIQRRQQAHEEALKNFYGVPEKADPAGLVPIPGYSGVS